MKKVCIVSLYSYHLFNQDSKNRFGGAQLQLFYLAKELSKNRLEVHFVLEDEGQKEQITFENIILHKSLKLGVKLKYLRIIPGLLKLIRTLHKINADFYIQRTSGIETGIVALFCKIFKKKFIYMVAHDEDVSRKKPTYIRKGLIGSIRWILFKYGLKNAFLVITQHDKQKRILKREYNIESMVIPSSYPLKKIRKNIKKDFILWVARGDAWKQPSLFLDLARAFPKKRFVMIMPKSNEVSLFNKIKKASFSIPNLTFIDFVPINKINKYFCKAKVFVNTSTYEGFPNTFIQAWMNGTPVISINVDPSGIISRESLGFKSNTLLQAKKDIIKLDKKDVYRRIQENCYRYVKKNHDIKNNIKKILKILK